jgi:hypothetical protein
LNNFKIELFDKFGSKISIKKVSTRKYTDEIRMRIKTPELEKGVYFYSLRVNDEALVNGKLVIGNYDQLTAK